MAALTASSLASAADNECLPQWSSFGLDSGGTVYAIAEIDHGDGPVLYAGGGVTGFLLRRVGNVWQPLPNGPIGEVRGLLTVEEDAGPVLYATGEFMTAGGVALSGIGRFDGTEWTGLGDGVGGFGLALRWVPQENSLYAGGFFTMTPSGVVVNNIARWDGTAWKALGAGTPGVAGPVFDIERFDDGLGGGPAIYVAGTFQLAGGAPASNIARWNGSQWSPVGSGSNGFLRALAVFDDGNGAALYAGGATSNGSGALVVRRWNGMSWQSVAESFNGTIMAMTVFDDGTGSGPALFVGGSFTAINAVPPRAAQGVAKLTPTGWQPVASGGAAAVFTFLPNPLGEPAMLVGGGFSSIGGASGHSVARWNACLVEVSPPGDIDGDGVVNGVDLAILLGAWGACGQCAADFNGDGVVDGADLATLLGVWTG